MIRFVLGLFILICCLCAEAQDFQHRQYRVANGLPSDVIKAVAQDTLGFFWIATDDGLVQYNGINFIPYKRALHSQYAKGFLLTRDGRLLHYGDLDLIEIQNFRDTIIFKSIRRGARNPTDSMLWYPKSIFEDRHGDIWMGEPQSVVKISGETMMRFEFPLQQRSPQFIRSFDFFEDVKGNLYTVSYFGQVYRFNESNQVFESTETSLPPELGAILKLSDYLYVAAGHGLFKTKLNQMGGIEKPTLVVALPNAMDVQLFNTDQLIVTSADGLQLIYHEQSKSIQTLSDKIANANMAYVSQEGDLWLASTEGLNLLQRNTFRKAGDENTFIESIVTDSLANVYFCTMRYLYYFNEKENSPKPEKILDLPQGYFQSLVANKNGLWASNGFSLLLLRNNRIVRRWDLEQEGRFIHDLFEDSAHNIWLSQAGNSNVNCLLPDFSMKRYTIPLSPESSVNAVREGPDGIYVLANGISSNLFFKAKNEDSFRNISQQLLDVNEQSDFNLTDMTYNSSAIWLASTEGLLRIANGQISRIDLGEQFTKLSVKNVKSLSDGQLLFSNSFGLFRYEIATGDFWLYDESNGLASNTLTTRGIYIDAGGHVWVGTSKGLSYSLESLINPKQTLRPLVVDVRVNGVLKKFTSDLRVPYNSFVEIKVSSITFPENNIIYQYRQVGRDTIWHSFQQNQIALSDLKSGSHTVQVRARKNGGFSWSNLTTLRVQVLPPFWQQPIFVLAVIISIGLIAWVSFGIATAINNRRRTLLEQVIAQRTHELKLSNEELSTRNTELDRFVYSASHDLSAPLKSLLGLVYVARKENLDANMISYLNMMEQSIKKLEDFIRDVTNYSRNARMEVIYKAVDLKAIVTSVLSDLQYVPGFETIEFNVDIKFDNAIITDEMRIRIILNNLISNAIKFRWPTEDRKAMVNIRAKNISSAYLLTITDNGRGIPEDQTKKVFNMFYRGTDSVPGSGLGLYILQEAVSKLGGTVKLESELGKGSTFTITIPEAKN